MQLINWVRGEKGDSIITWKKILVILLVVGYCVSPIDIIPDITPFLGVADDSLLGLLGLILVCLPRRDESGE